jgi:hypothetical protein
MRLISLVLGSCLWAVTAAAADGVPGEVYGVVADAVTGSPIAGAKVDIIEVKTDNPLPLRDSLVTGLDGSFRFVGLTANTILGGYVIQARCDRYWITQTDPMRLAAGEKKRVDLEPRKKIALTVTVRDSAGASSPLRGAHVLVEPTEGNEARRAKVTDSLGRSGFGDLSQGAVGLTLALEGYRTRYLRNALSGMIWDESVAVSLEKLPQGVAKSIRGSLSDLVGKPLGGVQVFFKFDAPEGRPILFGTSGQDGGFAITGIPAEITAGTLFVDGGRSFSAVSLTKTETEAAFSVDVPGALGVIGHRETGAPTMRARPWYLDFSLLGRRKRSGK